VSGRGEGGFLRRVRDGAGWTVLVGVMRSARTGGKVEIKQMQAEVLVVVVV
jgi:hypothetical protein